jgi:hypothetical protein
MCSFWLLFLCACALLSSAKSCTDAFTHLFVKFAFHPSLLWELRIAFLNRDCLASIQKGVGKLESEWGLSGCVQGARNEIFALQPAPVQTSYMGFPATMGANFLPYLITDKVVAPDSCRHCYSENLALMPNCYFVNDYKHAHMVHPPPSRQLACALADS